MRILYLIALVGIGLLNLAAGAAKIMQAPQEVQFFAEAGVDQAWMIPLGALQVLGALSLAIARVRPLGLTAVGLGFLAGSAMIFATGNTLFGLLSLGPVAICLLLWFYARRRG